MFSQPRVKQLLSQYTLVQLYTDAVPKRFQPTTSAEENKELQRSQFGDAQLPLYVIIRPQGNGKYDFVRKYEEGKINNVEAFMEFLSVPLAASQPHEAAQTAGVARN